MSMIATRGPTVTIEALVPPHPSAAHDEAVRFLMRRAAAIAEVSVFDVEMEALTSCSVRVTAKRKIN